jgi:cytochrome c oxidase assembly protein subunit 11
MKISKWLILIPIAMFGFSFALIPVYNVFCEQTGLNGKGLMARSKAPNNIDQSRWITMEFSTTMNEELPWQFRPAKTVIKVHPGEVINTSYFAKNLTNDSMVVQAIPSISPGLASKHLKKVECFCFQQQTLKGGSSRNMPLVFFIDPKVPKDVHNITLSYTLFNVTEMAKNAS